MDVLKHKLKERYQAQGYGDQLFRNDWNLILRIGVHPQVATVEDLQKAISRASAQSTRAHYASRIRSTFKAFRKMGLIDNMVTEDLPDIRKKRGLPHPLTKGEAELLMTEARQPMRDWFFVA